MIIIVSSITQRHKLLILIYSISFTNMDTTLSPSLLSWLRCFNAAAHHLGFTKAANELCITQSSISQQIKHLEDWIGKPLFYRTPRTLTLTQEGKRLFQVVSESFHIIESTLDQLKQPSNPPEIRLSCSPSFAMRWLTPRIGAFIREYPASTLRIYGEFHTLNWSQMTQGHINAGIRFDQGNYTDVLKTQFLEEWLIPVASTDFLHRHPEITSPQDITSSMMLHDMTPWENAEAHVEWNHWLEQVGISIPAKHDGQQFNLSQMSIDAAICGQGIAMGRLSLVYDDLLSGRLIDIFKLHVRSQAAYYFVTTPSTYEETSFIEHWLKNEAAIFSQNAQSWVQSQQCKRIT